MKDMFDCLEESYNFLDEEIYLVKIKKNKKRQKRKIYYLETISQDGRITWTLNMEDAINLFPRNHTYEIIKDEIRNLNISCMILRVPKNMKLEIIGGDVEPLKEETLWNKVKNLWKTFLIG